MQRSLVLRGSKQCKCAEAQERTKSELGARLLLSHRRRMEREAKAKFIASVWGAELVQFLASVDLEE